MIKLRTTEIGKFNCSCLGGFVSSGTLTTRLYNKKCAIISLNGCNSVSKITNHIGNDPFFRTAVRRSELAKIYVPKFRTLR